MIAPKLGGSGSRIVLRGIDKNNNNDIGNVLNMDGVNERSRLLQRKPAYKAKA